MRALVVYCHPRPDSFTAAVSDVVVERLEAAGAEVRVQNLYRMRFNPVMVAIEHVGYEDEEINQQPVERELKDLTWCDTLIFVYPTWWYGLPAMLKGWLDRVLVPGVAFLMPDETNSDIRPGLGHINAAGRFHDLRRLLVADTHDWGAGQTDDLARCAAALRQGVQRRPLRRTISWTVRRLTLEPHIWSR